MVLQIRNISKSYGDKVVLDGVNATIGKGIYGFLGANGVGKTTFFKIISGFLKKFEGEIKYPKLEKNNKCLLGFLPQSFSGYSEMKVKEFLEYIGSIKASVSKQTIYMDIDEKLEVFNLSNLSNKKIKNLSGGQLRRVGLAQAFLLNPRIVMLDEPTTGLDPTERINFKNYIMDFSRNQTVLISTHIVSDLENIAKGIFILKDGNFVMNGPEEMLIKQCEGLVWEAEFKSETEMHRHLNNCVVSMFYEKNGSVIARIVSSYQPVENASPVKPNLNDVYLFNFKEEAKIYVD